MSNPRGSPRRLLTTAVLLCTLVVFCSAALARHTDDGCAVERHCFACAWTTATTAEIIVPSLHAPFHASVTAVLPARFPVPLNPTVIDRVSRGPPDASRDTRSYV